MLRIFFFLCIINSNFEWINVVNADNSEKYHRHGVIGNKRFSAMEQDSVMRRFVAENGQKLRQSSDLHKISVKRVPKPTESSNTESNLRQRRTKPPKDLIKDEDIGSSSELTTRRTTTIRTTRPRRTRSTKTTPSTTEFVSTISTEPTASVVLDVAVTEHDKNSRDPIEVVTTASTTTVTAATTTKTKRTRRTRKPTTQPASTESLVLSDVTNSSTDDPSTTTTKKPRRTRPSRSTTVRDEVPKEGLSTTTTTKRPRRTRKPKPAASTLSTSVESEVRPTEPSVKERPVNKKPTEYVLPSFFVTLGTKNGIFTETTTKRPRRTKKPSSTTQIASTEAPIISSSPWINEAAFWPSSQGVQDFSYGNYLNYSPIGITGGGHSGSNLNFSPVNSFSSETGFSTVSQFNVHPSDISLVSSQISAIGQVSSMPAGTQSSTASAHVSLNSIAHINSVYSSTESSLDLETSSKLVTQDNSAQMNSFSPQTSIISQANLLHSTTEISSLPPKTNYDALNESSMVHPSSSSHVSLDPITHSSPTYSSTKSSLELLETTTKLIPQNSSTQINSIVPQTSTISQVNTAQISSLPPDTNYNAVTESSPLYTSSSSPVSFSPITHSNPDLSSSESSMELLEASSILATQSASEIIQTLSESNSNVITPDRMVSLLSENMEIESSTPFDLIQKDRDIVSEVMRKLTSLPSNKKCKTNEVYLRCGPNCPFSCQETGIQRKPCRNRCREGCFCQFGFIRFRRSCIPEKHCPALKCLQNEVYNECGTTCPKRCVDLVKRVDFIHPSGTWNSSKKLDFVCEMDTDCVRGCFCKADFVLDARDRCVPLKRC